MDVEETVIHVTDNASWLPAGGRAEVVRQPTAPQPMCVVRLLLRRDDRVFCTQRPDTGTLDLPMRTTEEGDPDGSTAIQALVELVVGSDYRPSFVDAVRNVVNSSSPEYGWPTPLAHFGVWATDGTPLVEGIWVSLKKSASALHERHWHPLVL